MDVETGVARQPVQEDLVEDRVSARGDEAGPDKDGNKARQPLATKDKEPGQPRDGDHFPGIEEHLPVDHERGAHPQRKQRQPLIGTQGSIGREITAGPGTIALPDQFPEGNQQYP